MRENNTALAKQPETAPAPARNEQTITIAVTPRQRWELAQAFIIQVKGQEARKVHRVRRAFHLEQPTLAALEKRSANAALATNHKDRHTVQLTTENIETTLEVIGRGKLSPQGGIYLGELLEDLETAKLIKRGPDLPEGIVPVDPAAEDWMPKAEPPLNCPECGATFTAQEALKAEHDRMVAAEKQARGEDDEHPAAEPQAEG